MSTPASSSATDAAGFITSGRAVHGVCGDVDAARQWLLTRRAIQRCDVRRVAFSDLVGWHFEDGSGDLVHDSGQFFRVQGVRARSDFPVPLTFEQPIINQPEVGVLGILAKRFDGVLHFLLQAKMEPGNVDLVQLSPTVQATRSNYTRVHGGTRPRFLDFFLQRTHHRVLVDQLQSEQGLFFRRKRNRNIIVETTDDVPEHEDFQWLTLGQIKQLLKEPHTVNMDTRTVIAAIPLTPLSARTSGWQSMDTLLSWLTEIRASASIDSQPCGLDAIEGWERDAFELRRSDGRYFKVCSVGVHSDAREVPAWTQPMIQPIASGVSAFVTKRIGGQLHFLIQARMEPGVWNLIELGPTVQYLPGTPLDDEEPPFMLEEVLHPPAGAAWHRSTQCEEGGRFYQYVTENIVIEMNEADDRPVPPHYTWATLGQLNTLIQYGNHINIEARSVLACLDVMDDRSRSW